jgi:hypothetical protein
MSRSLRLSRVTGWMLRANRTLNEADPVLRSGKEFARLFRHRGEKDLAASQVTRWERGDLPAPREVVRRYEHMLSLPSESLVAVCDAMARIDSVPWSTHHGPAEDAELHALLERACGGTAVAGREWARLGEIVASTPGLVLHPPQLWEAVTSRLLSELVVADHLEWLLRQEAMSRLLEHPKARQYGVAQCIEMVHDQQNPAVIEPLSLLDVAADPVANAHVLQQVVDPADQRTLQGALLAAAQKIRRGHYSAEERGRVVDTAARWAREGLNPDRLAMGGTAIADEPEPPGALSERISQITCATLAADDDPLLATLVDQALFGVDPDRRLVAAMCIAATPYQYPVAGVIVALAENDLRQSREDLAAAALPMLTNLGVDVHRAVMRQILTSARFSGRLRTAAAWSLPHCRGRYPEAVWRTVFAKYDASWRSTRGAESAQILRGLAYGIGTDGHAALLDDIRADPSLPPDVRRTASWLRRCRLSESVAAVSNDAIDHR